ncbi:MULTISPECIES: hypothetical protein [unclassified Haladaptatus]|uniref:hypothetical protein n=1 Tax=unclassified Haladaptatus TaxID=2622732 RepID=UPI0023E837EA|nr:MULTISPECIES: hypothetical protein [unclassified Haladaptatus]
MLGVRNLVAKTTHRCSLFLDEHWAFKYYVVPIVLMASVLFALALGASRLTSAQSLELVAAFLVVCFAVAASGVLLEKGLSWVGTRRQR